MSFKMEYVPRLLLVMQVYCLPFITLLTTGEVEYYVSKQETNWGFEMDNCSLATPDLLFYNATITTNVDVANLELAADEQVWLGYVRKYETFLYIGCMLWRDVRQIQTANYSIHSEPGSCYAACGKKGIFGLFNYTSNTEAGIRCFCLEETALPNGTDIQKRSCHSQCSTSGVACGGRDQVSLYRNATGRPSPKPYGSRVCLSYDLNSKKFGRDNCSVSLLVICQSENGEVHCVQDQNQQPIYKNWIGSSKTCYENSLYPVAAENVHKLGTSCKNRTSLTWTGLYANLAIYKYNETGQPRGSFNQHAILNVTNNRGRVLFSAPDSKKPRIHRALCQREKTSTVYTTATDLEAKTTTSVEKKKGHSTEGLDGESANVPLYTGVSVGCVMLVVLVIVTVVVLLRRRKAVPTVKSAEGKQDEGTFVNQLSVIFSVENTSDECHYDEAQYTQAEYEQRDSQSKIGFKLDTDDVYDTTVSNKDKEIMNKNVNKGTENVYNSLNCVRDDTYNVTDSAKSKTFGNIVTENVYDRTNDLVDEGKDDTYNIAESAKCKTFGNNVTENMYARTNDLGGKDDTYNIAESAKSKTYGKTVTDNVYDRTNDLHDGVIDDTYNVTDSATSKTFGNAVTENVYDRTKDLVDGDKDDTYNIAESAKSKTFGNTVTDMIYDRTSDFN